jgi:hypothetical protein
LDMEETPWWPPFLPPLSVACLSLGRLPSAALSVATVALRRGPPPSGHSLTAPSPTEMGGERRRRETAAVRRARARKDLSMRRHSHRRDTCTASPSGARTHHRRRGCAHARAHTRDAGRP